MKQIAWNKFTVLLAGLAIAAGMAGTTEAVGQTNGLPPMDLLLTPQQFVSDAAMGGMKEVYLSRLALDKSTNQEVRRFASRMVRDHSEANTKLEKLAQRDGLSFPPTNTFNSDDPNWNNPLLTHPEDIKQAQLLTMTNLPGLADYRAVQQLKPLNGAEFDGAYAAAMDGDHVQAVHEFARAAKDLPDEPLKKFADKTLPTLRSHSMMAQELDRRLNPMPASTTNGYPAFNGTNMPQPSPGLMPVNPP